MRIQITIPSNCERQYKELNQNQRKDFSSSIQNHIINILNVDLVNRAKAEKFVEALLRSPEWRMK